MEKCLKDFEVKVQDTEERTTKGVEEFEHEIDEAIFEFIMKGNLKEGEARAEQAVRRTKAAVCKAIFDIKEGRKIMCKKIWKLERERRKREDELEEQN